MTDARPLGLVVVVEAMVISLLFDDRRNPLGAAIRLGVSLVPHDGLFKGAPGLELGTAVGDEWRYPLGWPPGVLARPGRSVSRLFRFKVGSGEVGTVRLDEAGRVVLRRFGGQLLRVAPGAKQQAVRGWIARGAVCHQA